ncbi:DNA topoisomerase IV subunit A [Desulfobulbus propionicus DSM 2032]|jgi:topoisomerase-4 subunit A|uniref:DNA topoisomerase IV subunit A n=1 Tax=Desulfobulbus propionicus (strain ATCC 33891 / DSM 2032 / VKM B-1956 / 1pr3) TaxID=577650 RepID=A0A7U3YLM8_DESPD|nr:DNA topoisomerase IV subunit A [Desulfobulbus propionicus]ADW17673.1 DNA topoisomerase IV subunit A [Desulfobulbus propionicus DSM 2032]
MSETTEQPRGKLHQLFDTNFLDYTSYVIRERAIPDVDDGLKPVQRRILQTLANMDDGRFHKVANVVGETMKLHPHGDQSIFDALVNLANKGYLIDRQGNFGNIFTGDQASAPRYIECRLSPLARETLFNKDLTEFIDSYDGRMQEPVRLPAKIPLLLLLGAEGIAVGMATKIMPHNFGELLQAQIDYLRGQEFVLYPDFPRGGIIDVADYNHGNGRIRCRAKLEQPDSKTIVITELPYNLTTQALIESIEKAAKANKLKIASINDYTAEKVEVEIKLARGVLAEETIDALYAFTDCELSVSPSLVTIVDNMPRQMAVEEVLRRNTDRLVANLERELQIELGRLEDKWHARKLEQIFIEERLYKQIEEKTNYKEVQATVRDSLLPFANELKRKITPEDVERLLEIKIRRISRYDINRQQKELRDIEKQIGQIKKHLTDMIGFTVAYLGELAAKYGSQFPRASELRAFDEVDARAAALSNLTVGYHRESGFLGHKIKAEDEAHDLDCACSEYDRLLLIFKDGLYKVIHVPDKLFVGPDLYWLGVVKNDLVFNLIYRHGPENLAYVKRFATPKFILGRDYRLFEADKRSAILLLLLGKEGLRVRASLAPSARAKYNAVEIELDEVLIKGVSAKGKRIANRAVRRVTDITGTPKKAPVSPLELPGFGGGSGEKE